MNQSFSLSSDEQKSVKVFFNNFDRAKTGSINAWELQIALEAMNENPTSSSLSSILHHLHVPITGQLDLNQFMSAIQLQRNFEHKISAENEKNYLAAFVCMGGKEDETGSVVVERVRKVLKDDFGLTFKIDEMLEDYPPQQEGILNYQEFKALFS